MKMQTAKEGVSKPASIPASRRKRAASSYVDCACASQGEAVILETESFITKVGEGEKDSE